MSKYNKSQIMKSAWTLVKNKSLTISQALKKAWTLAKQNLNKDYTNVFALVEKETEKAVLLKINTTIFNGLDDVHVKSNFWFPKSCIKNLNSKGGFFDIEKQILNKKILEQQEKFTMNRNLGI